MAFPVVEGTAESAQTSNSATLHTITLPASIASTDLVLITMNIGQSGQTWNALTDWGELLDEGVANGLVIWRYTGSGVPSNPTFTCTGTGTRSAAIAWRISNADKSITPQIGTTATGSSATPDPPSVTPTGGTVKDYLFIAFAGMAGEEADDDTWANTPPTNYTPSPPLQKTCGTAGTSLGGLICAASRQLNTGSAQDPGTFGVDVSNSWRAQTIIVHPIVAPPQGAATGSIAWAGSATGARMSSGSASGSVTWAGAATGARTSSGAASGAVAWVGSATGEAPSVPPNEGTAAGAVDWSGTATGTTARSGSASGSITWVGTATGVATHSGAATGGVTWAGTATGATTHQGTASGTITWAGSATGEAPSGVSEGAATGTITWVGTATGQHPAQVEEGDTTIADEVRILPVKERRTLRVPAENRTVEVPAP